MKIKLDEGAHVIRAHDDDAGLDLCSREDKIVPAHGSAVFDTGVHVELPCIDLGGIKLKTAGLLMSKSGLNVKHGLTSEGVIDVGYTGSIVVKLYNDSDVDYYVKAGDKISQMLIGLILTPTLEVVDELGSTERGDGGFGSTGRQYVGGTLPLSGFIGERFMRVE